MESETGNGSGEVEGGIASRLREVMKSGAATVKEVTGPVFMTIPGRLDAQKESERLDREVVEGGFVLHHSGQAYSLGVRSDVNRFEGNHTLALLDWLKMATQLLTNVVEGKDPGHGFIHTETL